MHIVSLDKSACEFFNISCWCVGDKHLFILVSNIFPWDLFDDIDYLFDYLIQPHE